MSLFPVSSAKAQIRRMQGVNKILPPSSYSALTRKDNQTPVCELEGKKLLFCAFGNATHFCYTLRHVLCICALSEAIILGLFQPLKIMSGRV